MKIDVCLYASLASRLPETKTGNNTALMDVADGTTIGELLNHLSIQPDEPKIVFRNGLHAKLGDIINEGDRVAIFPPVAGG
jgi:molybdopterin converting factor small subunit